MFSQGDSSAGPILLTCAVIGGIIGFWFWDASQFHPDLTIDPSYKSYLPDKCSIIADRAGDIKKSAQVYFWGATTRIDLKITSLEGKVTEAHAIVTPGGTTYRWLEGSQNGDILRNTKDYSLMQNVSSYGNRWFCVPWVFFDYSKLDIPKNVTFNEPTGN